VFQGTPGQVDKENGFGFIHLYSGIDSSIDFLAHIIHHNVCRNVIYQLYI